MPSPRHELTVELFREDPSLAAVLLAGPLGIEVPRWRQARLASGELPQLAPTEFHADAVIVLYDGERPVLSVSVEVQLRRDGGKRRSWPAYLANLYARYGCPAVLLVVCPDDQVAAWCGRPIEVGRPGWVLRPVVLGPRRVPVLTDPAEAVARPQLAVLSALAHGGRPEGEKVLQAFVAGLEAVDGDHGALYTDLVMATLPGAVRSHLEKLMNMATYELQSDWARRHFGRGKAEGKAESVLAVLAARGIEVSPTDRERIIGCDDPDQLDRWLCTAVTAESVADMFAGHG